MKAFPCHVTPACCVLLMVLLTVVPLSATRADPDGWGAVPVHLTVPDRTVLTAHWKVGRASATLQVIVSDNNNNKRNLSI